MAAPSRGIHHRAQVIHPLLERRQLVVGNSIGKPGAAFIEDDETGNDASRLRKLASGGSSHASFAWDTQPGT